MSENKSIIDLATASTGGQPSQPPLQPPTKEENNPKNILEELLKNVQDKMAWVDVEVPSRGLANNGTTTVQLRPFTFEDEKILRGISTTAEGAAVIPKLFSRCMKGIEYADLLVVDKNYILYKLRALSYGADYKIKATCEECTYESQLTVGLNDLPINYAEKLEDLQGKITLPDSGVEVEIRTLTTADEVFTDKISEITGNLWRFIKTVDGHSGRSITQGFVSGTTARDISTIRNSIFNNNIGIQTLVNFICKECNHHSALELPINETFFDAS